MFSISTYLQLLALAFALASAPVLAEGILFEPRYWDEKALFTDQSSDGDIESILADNINFEPLFAYHANSLIRALARPVGRLKIQYPSKKFTTCTASLVADDLLITNYHCVPGTGKHGEVQAVKIEMGYYSDENINPEYREFAVDAEPISASSRLDYSLLRVNGSPGTIFGTVSLSVRQPENTEQLLLIHHPAGRIKHATRGRCRAGRITSAARGSLSHKCDTLPGSSGAPIFSDKNELVAIHCCGTQVTGMNAFNEGKILAKIAEHAGDSLPISEDEAAHMTGYEIAVDGENILASATSEPTTKEENFEQCLSLAYLSRNPEEIINCVK